METAKCEPVQAMMFDLIVDALLPFVLLANSEKNMGYFTFVTYSRVMKEPLYSF